MRERGGSKKFSSKFVVVVPPTLKKRTREYVYVDVKERGTKK